MSTTDFVLSAVLRERKNGAHKQGHANSLISFFIPDDLRGHRTILPKPHWVKFCKENSRF
jgi:hypothetical protein